MGDGDRSQKADRETSQEGRSGRDTSGPVQKMKGGTRLEREPWVDALLKHLIALLRNSQSTYSSNHHTDSLARTALKGNVRAMNENYTILLGRATLGPNLSAGQPSTIPQHQ